MAVVNTIKCLPYLEDSYNAKMVCFGEGAIELCTSEKAVFFIPVNMLTVWCAGFVGCTTRYRVSRYTHEILNIRPSEILCETDFISLLEYLLFNKLHT